MDTYVASESSKIKEDKILSSKLKLQKKTKLTDYNQNTFYNFGKQHLKD